ncbi:cadherin domain-containing protein [Microvirga sp. 2MCAF35]|uniref:cadherin domain-containing protein n=1 Tax=Microvirga sp. 2MCAF35 TaxID=3232987 RepID=UPI003F969D95
MTYSTLAAPDNIGIVVGEADPSTSINIAENGEAGRVIGELVFENFEADHTYSFSFVDPVSDDEVEVPFEVVAGTGDDAGKFFFKLKDGEFLDFEAAALPAFSIKIATVGSASMQPITVTIDNVAEAPTAIVVGNGTTLTITENAAAIADLGAISHQDGIAGDYTYTLVPAWGESNPYQLALEELFAIVDGHLVQLAPFDHEAFPNGIFTFKIRAEIDGVADTAYEELITVTVANVVEAPTEVAVDGQTALTITENADPDESLGTIGHMGGDEGVYTYTLVAADGEGNPDADALAALFEIDAAGHLVQLAPLDREAYPDGTFTFKIKAQLGEDTDTAFEQEITVTVANVNEAPTAIDFGTTGNVTASVDNDASLHDVIATLRTIDQDVGDTHTYMIVTGDGEDDAVVNSAFTIEDGKLVVGDATALAWLDGAQTIWIKSTDSGQASVWQQVTVNVQEPVNHAPTAVKVKIGEAAAATTITVAELGGAGREIGTLSADDQDQDQTHTYAIVDQNSPFEIVEGENGAKVLKLKANVVLDREAYANGTFTLHIKVTDNGNPAETFTQAITVNVGDENEAPTGITLSKTTIAENAAAGTEIGVLAAMDPDFGDSFTFSLSDNAGGAFKLENGKIVVADASKLDYETAASHKIKVKVTDAGGLFFEKEIMIGVTDVAESIGGAKKNDKLVGGIGADILDGKAGKDTLTGGLGKDAFVFSTKLGKSNVDKITDFKLGEDMIYLDNAVFKKLGKAGSMASPAMLKKANFVLGSKAKDKNDYVGYDSKKGVLWYDSNGSAAGGQETIATLSKKLKMTFDHFFIV